jgi:sugar transferase (PEP-CTERM/EpsH1 system associated)
MRILALTHRLPYAPNRGDRIRSYHVLKHLRRDHEVELVSLVHDRDEASHAHDLEPLGIQAHVAPVSRARGALRAAVGLTNGTSLTHCLLDSPAVAPILQDIVARHRPDVVLAFCSSMARFALAPPLDDIPLVHDMIDVDSAKWASLAGSALPPKRWIYAREHRTLSAFERVAARSAATTLVVNARERVLLRQLAPDAPVVVVENGVDLDRFQPAGPPADAPVAVFCGVMNYQPNEAAAVWIARTVWPLVIARRPDARLMLVGATPSGAVRALANASITVTGSVPDTRPYLWDAAVGLAPLLTARGIQNKVLEAVAAGLPVVVTPQVREGLPPEIVPAVEVAAAPQEFAEAVLALFERSPAERRAIAGRAAVGALAWPARLETLSAIIAAAHTRRADGTEPPVR